MAFIEKTLNRERLPYPLQQIGIGGFSLFARVAERITLKADNPINYVEDGSSLNDHRIKKPEVLTIRGVVGDIYRSPNTLVDRVQNIDDSLGQITQYFPRLTATQRVSFGNVSSSAVSQIEKIEGLISGGVQINNLFGNLDNASKSLGEQFLDAMESIHYGNQLISIQMPYRIYDNMCINSLVIDRNNTSDGMEFVMEAQRFRIADLNFVAVERVSTANGGTAQKVAKNPAKALNGQDESIKEKGAQDGKAVDAETKSALTKILGG